MAKPLIWIQQFGNLLLDRHPGAIAAYSLSSLRTDYSGPIARVRRSSDNQQQDFAASAVSSIASFCGPGNNGFLVRLYDQSINQNHSNTISTNDQPLIVSNGQLITSAGKPAIRIPQSTSATIGPVAVIAGFKSLQNLSVFAYVTPVNGTTADGFTSHAVFAWGDGTNGLYGFRDGTGLLTGETGSLWFNNGQTRRLGSTAYTRLANVPSIITSFHLLSGSSVFVNGLPINLGLSSGMTAATPAAPVNTSFTANDEVRIWDNGVAGRPASLMTYVFYPSNQSANRVSIESIILN